MGLSRPGIAVGSAVAAVAAATAIVVAGQGGGGSKSSQETVVAAERGPISITVGGIGHVTTLTGAARLAVPAAAPSSASSGSASAVTGATGAASAASGSGPTAAPADAVFPAVAGHVEQLFVRVGEQVVAGQPVARLADDGTAASAVLQARSDLDTARLELAQKSAQDPARGPAPTGAEIAAGRQGVLSAQAKLERVIGKPLPADVNAAKLDLAKAVADLHAARSGTPAAITAAELAVTTAQQKLQTLTGAPDPAELLAAQLDVARATLDQETLFQNTPTPTFAERNAAQLAVSAAQRKLDELIHPPGALVSAAQGEVAKAEADLAALRATKQGSGLSAAQAAVTAAKSKLAQLTRAPARDLVTAARLDVRKAQADLAVLRQRGSPASATDLALGRLKVNVGRQRLALAQDMTRRLSVVAGSSGTVTSLLTTPGAAVDAATPIMRVQDLAHLVVALDLSEFDVSRIRVGALSRVSVDALGGRKYGGRVIDVAASGNDTGGVVNFPVMVGLNRGDRLRPGMSVSTRIVVASRADVLRIPLAGVNDRADHPNVLVKEVSGATTKRPVELGLAGPRFVEVRSGLKAGERVVVPAGNQG